MSDFHSIIRSLKSRDHVEENLNAYIQEVKNRAGRFALVDLSLKALALAEILSEKPKQTEALISCGKEMKKLSDGICPDRKVLEELRDDNIRHMQRLTDDVDVYSTNEYLLNRIEHRFKDTDPLPESYSDQNMVEELLKFISLKSDEEQNLYTAKMIEQLPVRMTRLRFLEVVAQRLSIYRGNDKNSFDEIMMMLRSASLLKETGHPMLSDITTALSETPVKEMNDKVYDSAFNILSEVSSELSGDIDLYQLYQEVLNDLLASAVCFDAVKDLEISEDCRKILSGCADVLLNESDEVSEELYDACTVLEGHPEEYLMQFKETEGFETDVLSRYPREIDNYGLVESIGDIQTLTRLLSNSLYASLAIPENEDLDPAYFNQVTSEYLKAVKDKLDHVTIPYARALMARVFTVLPPHFSSQEELETYIYDSLRSCNDAAEKKGTIELLHQIMEE